MKNLSLGLNVVLLIAVAFLYFKVYSGEEKIVSPAIQGAGMSSNAIVYINSDSLLDEYKYFNALKSSLEKKQDSIDTFLANKAQALEKEVVAYQKQAESLSAEQRAGEEERLMKKQQDLLELKQNLLDNLHEEESRMNDSIHDNLTKYLKEYNKRRGYLYILGYQRGSGILMANDSLDITKEVLKGLNGEK